MLEDKLTQEQRIRLECLALANITYSDWTAEAKLLVAEKFEKYILGEEK